MTDVDVDADADGEEQTIALLPGSRKQEIKDNLPMMLEAIEAFPEYHFVIAGAPGIEQEYYETVITQNPKLKIQNPDIVFNASYDILSHATAALVTSGTATLETALFGVPQVVCYYTPIGKIISWLRKKILKVKYISLVNLIVNRELVTELVADTMTVSNIRTELRKILPDSPERQLMLDGYIDMKKELGTLNSAQQTAKLIIGALHLR